MSAPVADTWRIVTIRGGSGTITHPVIAVAPGCPPDRHPTRDCKCRVHRSSADAQAYIAMRRARETCPDCGEPYIVRGLLSRCRPRHGAGAS